MDLNKNLKEIKNHFKNISNKKLEENIKKAGEGEIKSASDLGYKLVIPIEKES